MCCASIWWILSLRSRFIPRWLVPSGCGPNEGQGFSVYHDGSLVKRDSTKAQKNHTESSGTVIIGKRFTDRDEDYGSVMVDELMFWDRELLPEEMQTLATA